MSDRFSASIAVRCATLGALLAATASAQGDMMFGAPLRVELPCDASQAWAYSTSAKGFPTPQGIQKRNGGIWRVTMTVLKENQPVTLTVEDRKNHCKAANKVFPDEYSFVRTEIELSPSPIDFKKGSLALPHLSLGDAEFVLASLDQPNSIVGPAGTLKACVTDPQVDGKKLDPDRLAFLITKMSRDDSWTPNRIFPSKMEGQTGSIKFEFRQALVEGSYVLSIVADGRISTASVEVGSDGSTELWFGGPDQCLRLSESTKKPITGILDGATLTSSGGRYFFNDLALAELPLSDWRSPDQVALLVPGTVPGSMFYGRHDYLVGAQLGGRISINGARARDTSYTTNGADDNDELTGLRRQSPGVSTVIPSASISEVQVLSGAFDTRFGRSIAGEISVLSKLPGSSPRLNAALYSLAGGAHDYFDSTNEVSNGGLALPVTSNGLPGGVPVSFDLTPGYQGQLKRSGTAVGVQRRQVLGNIALNVPVSQFFRFGLEIEQHNASSTSQEHYSVPTVEERGYHGSGATGLHVIRPPLASASNLGLLAPSSLAGNAIFSLYPFPNNSSGPFGRNTFTNSAHASTNATIGNANLAFEIPWLGGTTGSIRTSASRDSSVLPRQGNDIHSGTSGSFDTFRVAGFLNSGITRNLQHTLSFSFGRTSIDLAENRDTDQLPSAYDLPYLLNAPLLINVTAFTRISVFPLREVASPPKYVEGPLTQCQVSRLGSCASSEAVTGPVGHVDIAGFSGVGWNTTQFPQYRRDNTFQLASNWLIFRSNSSFMWGASATRVNLSSFIDRGSRPSFRFGGLASSSSLDVKTEQMAVNPRQNRDFSSPLDLASLGIPTEAFHTLAVVPEAPLNLSRQQIEFYGHYYRSYGRLGTLNIGARLGFGQLPRDMSKRVSDAFNPIELKRQVDEALPKCNSLLPDQKNDKSGEVISFRKNCAAFAQSLVGAFGPDLRSAFDVHNLIVNPRLGWAAPLSANGTTSVRLGAGLYSGPFPALIVDEARSAFLSYLPLNYAAPPVTTTGGSRLYNLANPAFPFGTGSTQCGVGFSQLYRCNEAIVQPGTLNLLTAQAASNLVTLLAGRLATAGPILTPVQPSAGLRAAESAQWSVSLEKRGADARTALSIGYVASYGFHLLRRESPDRGIGKRRLYVSQIVPDVPEILPVAFGDASLVDSEQSFLARTILASSGRSTYHSLQLNARTRIGGLLVGNAFTWGQAQDNGSEVYDTPGDYALPPGIATGHDWAPSSYDIRLRSVSHAIWAAKSSGPIWRRGWQLSGIVTNQSGPPFSVSTVNDVGDGNFTDYPKGVRLRQLDSSNSRIEFLGFGAGQEFSRNSFRSFGLFYIDLSAGRQFVVSDRRRAELRIECFNCSNHPNFGIPERVLEAPSFGQAVRTITQPRMIRVALRFQL